MQNEVILILLNDYADWESAYIAAALNGGLDAVPSGAPRYTIRTAAPTMEPVRSIGGLRTLPDYDFETLPEEYAALVLIGGMQWRSAEAEKAERIVRQAVNAGKPVGAICNAASWMAAHGFLNDVRHTGNTAAQLRDWGGGRYTNEAGYVECQACRDGGIVTANGSATLEFARELLLLLEADTPGKIEGWYDFNKHGFIR